MSHRDYVALVPSQYGHSLRVSGPLGARPDLNILRIGYGIGADAPIFEKCWKMRLSKSIEGLTFTFPRSGPGGGSFTHMEEFFVVTKDIKEFLLERSGAEFDSFPIKTLNRDGGPTVEKYWAVKCITRIDCIKDEMSVAFRGRHENRKVVSLKDTAQELELSEELIYEYANYEGNRQKIYTQYQVQHVFLDSSRIRPGLKLFEPHFLPSILIVNRNFAQELKALCKGDCFWTLELTDLNGQLKKLFVEMR
ncbi:MAG: hypothetical protein COA68_11340 [Oceanobacter sp.]|jgi:hypothetical protein|nr:MAG: hypothetical protein COA68_11340 [Oceanobacter sp.]